MIEQRALDGAKSNGIEFCSAHETVVVRICFVLLFSVNVLVVVLCSGDVC